MAMHVYELIGIKLSSVTLCILITFTCSIHNCVLASGGQQQLWAVGLFSGCSALLDASGRRRQDFQSQNLSTRQAASLITVLCQIRILRSQWQNLYVRLGAAHPKKTRLPLSDITNYGFQRQGPARFSDFLSNLPQCV